MNKLLSDFLQDTISPADFDHKSHVVVAHELLRHHDFNEAHDAYVRHLQALTVRAGVPEKFNATITFAAMSKIAERMGRDEFNDPAAFLNANPDLLRASSFTSGYSKERLNSDLARRIPLLPDLRPNAD